MSLNTTKERLKAEYLPLIKSATAPATEKQLAETIIRKAHAGTLHDYLYKSGDEALQQTEESAGLMDWELFLEGFQKSYGMEFNVVSQLVSKHLPPAAEGQEQTVEESQVEHLLELVSITKAVTSVEQALIEALRIHLRTIHDWEVRWLLDRVIHQSKEHRLVKIANVVQAMTTILLSDLDFIEFTDGLITGGPEAVSFMPVEKLTTEQEMLKCYDYDDNTYVSTWDEDRVTNLRKATSSAITLLRALVLSLDGRGAEFLPIIQSMLDTLAAFITLEESIGDMVVNLNDKRIIRVAPVETVKQEINVLKSASAKNKPTTLTFLTKSVKNQPQPIRITKSDEKEGIIRCVVLEPGVRDLQDQEATEEGIYEIMKSWMLNGQVLGIQHETFNEAQGTSNPDMQITQSFQAPAEFMDGDQKVTKGSWFVEIQLFEEELIKDVFSGDITGVSIAGPGLIIPD